MAIFDIKSLQDLQKLNFSKITNVLLHSCMVLLCVIGSVFFLQDVLYPKQSDEKMSFFQTWSIENIKMWIWTSINFLKIKILIPSFIFAYFYYCIKKNIFHKLLKDEYIQKYNQKYKKIHKISQSKHQKPTIQGVNVSTTSQSQRDTERDQNQTFNETFDSSLNLSMEMVRSMSKSMLGSMKSIGANPLSKSIVQKGSILNRSSQIAHNISNKKIQIGKDLLSLFQKGKNMSESFLSLSSSGIQTDQLKVRIKNKKYYEAVDENESRSFRKWYQLKNKMYIESLKSQKLQRNYFYQLNYLKKGLQKQLTSLLRQYKENSQMIRQCLVKFWALKIQSFESKKPFKPSQELYTLFQNSSKSTPNLSFKPTVKQTIIGEQLIFKKAFTAGEFINRLSKLNILLRNSLQREYAEKQLKMLLSKKIYYNVLFNICSIQGQLFSNLQVKHLKRLEKSIDLLSNNKIDIFSSPRIQNESNQMDMLEQQQVEKIRDNIETRMFILKFVVNKINTIYGHKNFKVKMNDALTYDSGYFTATLNFFKNNNFVQIVCEKGCDQLISHYNVKVYQNHTKQNEPTQKQGQSNQKQICLNCKPGIDNAFSVIFLLVKKASEKFKYRIRSDEKQEISQHQSFGKFIQNLYSNIQI